MRERTQTLGRGRFRCWMFTLNNWTERERESLSTHIGQLPRAANYLVYQQEVGENGTPHLQGYIELHTAKTLQAMKNLLGNRYHFERRRGTQEQAIAYCKKQETRVEGTEPTELGEKKQGRHGKLKELVQDIKEGEKTLQDLEEDYGTQFLLHRTKILNEIVAQKGKRNLEPNKDNVSIYTGPSGSGKTTTAWKEHPDAYKGVWPSGGRWWWPNYAGEDSVIFDEFRHNISYQQMLALFDIHPMTIEYKGGNCEMVSKKVIVTSIIDPKEWYPNVKDKTELERRIKENSTIFDFRPGQQYPNFVKVPRIDEFAFNEPDEDEYPPGGGLRATNRTRAGFERYPPIRRYNFALPSTEHEEDYEDYL